MEPAPEPPSDRLAAIGDHVARRLAAQPDVVKLPVPSIDMFVAPDFLGPADRRALIDRIEAGKSPSTLFSENDAEGYRTSDSCNLDPWDPFVRGIEARITTLLGIDPSHGETLQGQRYAPGQHFGAHHDFFHHNQPYWPEMEASGGQRSWTAMIYLNEPEAGGDTGFDSAGIAVQPRAGLLLTWNNMLPDGSPNLLTLHHGAPVARGVKYIVTKWYRERPWS